MAAFLLGVAAAGVGAPPDTPSTATSVAVSATSVTLPSGVIYKDLELGTGAEATTNVTVAIHYTGTLPSTGKVFDCSYDRMVPAPLQFEVTKNAVVAGLDEGVRGMKVGGHRLIFVPAALGYGSKGRAPRVPPDSDLLFDVRLVKVRE